MVSFKNIVLSLLFLILVSLSTFSSASSVQQQYSKAIKTVRQQIASSDDDDDHHHHGAPVRYRLFYIKNTTPLFPSRDSMIRSNRVIKRSSSRPILKRRNYKIDSKKNKIKNSSSRPNFSVMLPKGFVPPSGSSPCHNENPNSVVFFCGALKP